MGSGTTCDNWLCVDSYLQGVCFQLLGIPAERVLGGGRSDLHDLGAFYSLFGVSFGERGSREDHRHMIQRETG